MKVILRNHSHRNHVGKHQTLLSLKEVPERPLLFYHCKDSRRSCFLLPLDLSLTVGVVAWRLGFWGLGSHPGVLRAYPSWLYAQGSYVTQCTGSTCCVGDGDFEGKRNMLSSRLRSDFIFLALSLRGLREEGVRTAFIIQGCCWECK